MPSAGMDPAGRMPKNSEHDAARITADNMYIYFFMIVILLDSFAFTSE
jgi:hypothetical protein